MRKPLIALGVIIIAATVGWMASRDDTSGPTELTERETSDLKDELTGLLKKGGSQRRIKRVRQQLVNAGVDPGRLESTRFIKRQAWKYGGMIRERKGIERELLERKALRMGLTLIEMGLAPLPVLEESEQMRLIERILSASTVIGAPDAASRLKVQPLCLRARTLILSAIPDARGERRFNLFVALQNTNTGDVVAAYRKWSKHAYLETSWRELAVRFYVAKLMEIEDVAALTRVLTDKRETPSTRLRAVQAAKMADAEHPGLRAAALELASNEAETGYLRREALGTFLHWDGIEKEEQEFLLDLLFSQDEPSSMRLLARTVLLRNHVISAGASEDLGLLESDTSMDLRVSVAAGLRGTSSMKKSGIREAIAVVDQEASERRAPPSTTPTE